MNLVQNILTKNPCYTSGRKITVKGLMLHSVGCSQPKASVFMNAWNNSGANACVHGFIDGNDGTVYQTLPWNHRGWHGGGSSNNTHIGVEMCEPACIKYTGGSTFTCSDKQTAIACVDRTYKAAVELFAMLCKEFNLNPLGDGVIVSHAEGYKRGIATNHGDPEHLWRGLGTSYTMNKFRNDVYAAMNGKFEWEEKSVNYIGTVTADILNIRQQPNASCTIIGQHKKGDTVVISAETSNGWYKVNYPNIGIGYISGSYVNVQKIVEQAPSEPNIETVPVLDNSPDTWAKEAIDNSLAAGILKGDNVGNYNLHGKCTRQDVIIFLHRLYKSK